MNNTPVCYIVAGPNGAGKTTFALKYLPEIVKCNKFINVDMIAQGISPLDVQSAEIESAKMFLKKLNEFVATKSDFSFETTLSGVTYKKTIAELKDNGFLVYLFYLWIPSAKFSEKRVKSRVKMGGHNIPKDVIYRRYDKCNHNFINNYLPIVDKAFVYDNSTEFPELIFEKNEIESVIYNKKTYNLLRGATL
jgi:predicted ABC-type ATPase